MSARTAHVRREFERLLVGRGEADDLIRFERLARVMKKTSRCGLGLTASNPVTSSLENFPRLYEDRTEDAPGGMRRSFDLDAATASARALVGRDAGGFEA